jgi:serine/threonine protein kinase
LTTGARLGPYEVVAKLGEGGMGEVYRARDTKLGRDVALKILPEGFAHDPDRLVRFGREAQVLASLNHPNIAGIYGLEDSGDTKALVLELLTVPRSPIASPRERCPSTSRCTSRSRSVRHSKRRTTRASFTAT